MHLRKLVNLLLKKMSRRGQGERSKSRGKTFGSDEMTDEFPVLIRDIQKLQTQFITEMAPINRAGSVDPGHACLTDDAGRKSREVQFECHPGVDSEQMVRFDQDSARAKVKSLSGAQSILIASEAHLKGAFMADRRTGHGLEKPFGQNIQMVSANRTQQQAVATGLSAPGQLLLASRGSDDDNRKRSEADIIFDAAATFIPRHIAHVKIQKDQLRMFLFDQGEYVLSVTGHQKFDAMAAKKIAIHPSRKLRAIGYQYFPTPTHHIHTAPPDSVASPTVIKLYQCGIL